jgi:hypothetical protein
MKTFSTGMVGPGIVIDGVSVVMRQFHDGYRIYVNHRPCPMLPCGGYAANLNEAQHLLRRYRHRILGCAREGGAA